MKLLEVPFINGYNEFIEYFSKEIIIEIPDNFNKTRYSLELIEEDIFPDTLSYINMTNLNISFNVFITKNNEKSSIIIETYGELLNNLKLKVSYTFKNNEPKYLYSVDYNDGIVYFSEALEKTVSINYKYDNIFTIGKSAKQLKNNDFNNVDNNININNFKENSSISFVYKNNIEKHRKLTPIVQNLKLNYILKDDLSL